MTEEEFRQIAARQDNYSRLKYQHDCLKKALNFTLDHKKHNMNSLRVKDDDSVRNNHIFHQLISSAYEEINDLVINLLNKRIAELEAEIDKL